jgi:hypothetical protein
MRLPLFNIEAQQHIAEGSARIDASGAAIGIMLSLLLHGMLAYWVWNRTLLPADRSRVDNRFTLEVRLVTAPTALLPAAPALKPPAEQTRTVRTTQAARPIAARPIAARPIIVQAATPPSTTATAPEQPAATAEKHIDVESVRGGLAGIVADVDREKRDTPVGQLIDKPLYPPEASNKMARAIDGSTRSDCRNSIANTGLLAPLFLAAMAFDRKNSGCKW